MQASALDDLVRRIPWEPGRGDLESLVTREWLVTNGLGGYASGTISGVLTRRYHGLLIAALAAPQGRRVMLSHLSEQFRLPNGRVVRFSGEERVGGILDVHGSDFLVEFRLEAGLPVWRYEVEGFVLERQIVMPHLQNTVHVVYRLLEGQGRIRLKLRPAVAFRRHADPVDTPQPDPYRLSCERGCFELTARREPELPLRMRAHGRRTALTIEEIAIEALLYRTEESRGYEAHGDLWSPGYFRVDVGVDEPAALVASTESWETIHAMPPAEVLRAERERRERLLAVAPPAAREGLPAELVLAADQFIIQPAGRVGDEARAQAIGGEARTVIAGYHWFTDWGRDTMIGLEGLTLATGRHAEAGSILRTFAHHLRDGLIPNLFPEGEREGLYHTADATLWFFHALDRYRAITGDRDTLAHLMPRLLEVYERHVAGTRFGIGVDPADGLLRQGEQGYQLTWMDAKVGDWVVTPRRGKAVEIQALWYNALRLLEGWLRESGDETRADEVAAHAERARRSFHERFWYESGEYLYDVVDGEDGDDPALRPNQILAISLAHPILDRSRWRPVVDVVRERLVTPVGLRSLGRGHPDFKSKYFGDLRARDAAYHQGTVWGWLIGPFLDAWAKVHPEERAEGRRFLEAFDEHLSHACVGSISEVFDAEDPFTPRGCVAQAWSVAEVLRVWLAIGDSW